MSRRRKRTRRNWTEKEIQYLRDNHGTIPLKDIARHLHRKPNTVCAKASQLGIIKRPNKRFTPEEIAYITYHSSTLKASDIARHLGRTHHSILCKIYELGLPTFRKSKIEFRESIYPDILRMVMEGASSTQIGERFHLSKPQVDGYLYRHNIIRKNFQ